MPPKRCPHRVDTGQKQQWDSTTPSYPPSPCSTNLPWAGISEAWQSTERGEQLPSSKALMSSQRLCSTRARALSETPPRLLSLSRDLPGLFSHSSMCPGRPSGARAELSRGSATQLHGGCSRHPRNGFCWRAAGTSESPGSTLSNTTVGFGPGEPERFSADPPPHSQRVSQALGLLLCLQPLPAPPSCPSFPS